ncbi:MAG: DUF72 domain-containing protein [Agriterribacter sp.]
MKWDIGCSGFYYKEWKELFYPAKLAQKDWFEFYCTEFNSIELNGTFYRTPLLKNLQKWYDTSPANFSFSVKAPRLISHYKKFVDCKAILDEFYTLIQNGLGEKLKAILFQMPPGFTYSEERLELILEILSPGFSNVLEFRHSSWWQEKIFKLLGKKKIIFAGISHPSLPDDVICNTDTTYYRFHGIPKLYYSEYTAEAVKKITDQLLLNTHVEKALVYFNNTAGMGAINNASWMKAYLSSITNK